MAKREPKDRPIDYKEVKLLASVFCSEEEIAERLDFTYTGLRARKKRDKELVAAIKRGRSDGIRSLRALQFQAARRGSVPMLIWLGKQVLGQSNQTQPSDSEGPLTFTLKLPDPPPSLLYPEAKSTVGSGQSQAPPNGITEGA